VAGVNFSGFASHADFENQCGLCHAPLQTTQDVLCIACHTSVEEQVAKGEGYHGHIERVERCASCHLEHQGREFNPGQAALKYFDHDQVGFSLVKHQMDFAGALINCTSCHLADGRYSNPTAGLCVACHSQHAASFMSGHIEDYSPDCLECHDGQDRMLNFNHNTTAFPLVGKHTAVTCGGCHAG
jgi:hypothetical protein